MHYIQSGEIANLYFEIVKYKWAVLTNDAGLKIRAGSDDVFPYSFYKAST